MKKITLLLSLMIYGFQSVAQVTYEANSSSNSSTDYVGWDNSITNDPLLIKHMANQDIDFFTDATQRMTLKNSGELGIGVTGPNAWLHVKSIGTKETFRTDAPVNYDNYWRMFRNGTEYGRFINFNGATAFYIQAARGHLRLASGDGGNAIESFEIIGGSGSDAGFVGIGDYSSFTAQRLLDVYSNSNYPQFRILI